MDAPRQTQATKLAARMQLRDTVRDELAGRNDDAARQRRSAALMQRVRATARGAAQGRTPVA
ncbi:hypothetical protein [Capillimicrobium parvum]|uniref:Uncharacterized protein n=1 Tax=Capillimicrobium parvum TaxID=2884022 RepID=A0A9E7C0Z2_9ACTN|nr:hypothetical protein [Capillimicrobium parvum]UGS35893.1 hypothetical protein DSM104329_02290 [Capillimicrobium parvum]